MYPECAELVAEIDKSIKRRRHNILMKRPGTIDCVYHPKVIWLEMLHHQYSMQEYLNKIFAQAEKFNYILNNIAKQAKHFTLKIVSCPINSGFYDLVGNLSSSGKHSYWKEFDYLFKCFDRGEQLFRNHHHSSSYSAKHQHKPSSSGDHKYHQQ